MNDQSDAYMQRIEALLDAIYIDHAYTVHLQDRVQEGLTQIRARQDALHDRLHQVRRELERRAEGAPDAEDDKDPRQLELPFAV